MPMYIPEELDIMPKLVYLILKVGIQVRNTIILQESDRSRNNVTTFLYRDRDQWCIQFSKFILQVS